PSYNSQTTINDTIKSIINQTHRDIEYIIIDGLSTDKTLAIIDKYQQQFPIKLISESDKGIYDAMNKGIKMVSGDIVGILNSDDFYYNNNVLLEVQQLFKTNQDIDAVYGDLIYIDKDNINKQTRYWRSGECNEKKINNGWIIPHPTFFVKKEIYQKCAKLFDTNFSIAADYELMLRLLKVDKIQTRYLPKILVKMRNGGTSGKNIQQRIKGWQELKKAWLINNLKLPRFFITRRLFFKIFQYIF
ncbi:glycosyltransferase, partial [Patescibacteria group bacterium]|nr:glycosyltransferase [Patescibacteria group bacterium]